MEHVEGQASSTAEQGSALPRRLSRSANACQRCRKRKQKCDLQYPKCSSCVRANVPCLSYHAGKQAEIPRSYVSNLEAQIRQLKKENEELREARSVTGSSVKDESLSPGTSPNYNSGGGYDQKPEVADVDQEPSDLVVSMGLVALEGANEPRFMGTSSGITFAKIVMAAIQRASPITVQRSSSKVQNALPSSPASPSSLPPKNAAEFLVDIYFEHRTGHFPFLHRPTIEATINYVYDTDATHPSYDANQMEKSVFTAHMVFAIALCGVTNSDKKSEGCFFAAVQRIESVFYHSKSSLESLSSVLLLAQYILLNPSKGSLWHLAGVALRLCIDMGLHWETDAVLRLDPHILDTRRRLFWATYFFDRTLCITLGRPFGVVDQSINVGLPEVTSDVATRKGENANAHIGGVCYRKLAARHLSVLHRLQSEIKHVLYHQFRGTTLLAYPPPNYVPWLPDIRARVEAWYHSIPDPSQAHSHSIFSSQSWWEALYTTTLLLLYRPSPIIPCPSQISLDICYDAACRQISAIKSIYRQNRIDQVWIWVYQLFLSGLTMMYCLWHSNDIRTRTTLEDLMDTVKNCNSVLSALAERFPGAAGCRDTFDTLSSATLKWFTAKDSAIMQQEESSYLNFAHTVHQRVQPLPQHLNNHVPIPEERYEDAMFMDPTGLGETLASAAQWQDYGLPMDFSGAYEMDNELAFGNLFGGGGVY